MEWSALPGSMRMPAIGPTSFGSPGLRFGTAHSTGVMTMCLELEPFSAVSASASPIKLRAYSTRAYWKPPQVPTNGQSRRRANSMPCSMPSVLWYGLAGAAHSPWYPARSRSPSAPTSEGVGSHCDSTSIPSARPACCRLGSMVVCAGNSGLKSPRMPMRMVTQSSYVHDTDGIAQIIDWTQQRGARDRIDSTLSVYGETAVCQLHG